MRTIFLSISMLFIYLSIAQTTIVNDKYEKDNKPVGFSYLNKSHEMVIFKGKKMGGLVAASQTNSIYSYDLSGNKKTIVENEKLYQCTFSPSENTLRVFDLADGMFKLKEKYYANNQFGKSFGVDQSNAFPRYFPLFNNFTDKSILKLTNQNNKLDINFEKDNLILTVKDIITRKQNEYKIEKPSTARLLGASFVKPEKKLGLKSRFNSDESFNLITKSISADYTKTTIYRTTYSTIDGKLLSDTAFELSLKDKVFIYSNNGGGFTDTPANNSAPYFDDDLSINNYITDSNENVYIYGIYGDKMALLNKEANPKGYYVFKFDKTGKKLWESINNIDDKDFNDKKYMYFTETDLSILNDKLCFYAFVNEHKEFLNYGILDQNTGAQVKSSKIVFHEYMSRVGVGSDFFKLNYEYPNIKELKDKKFNVKGIIAYDMNNKFSEYVKSFKAKNETHFQTLFTNIGIWLLETDNEDYYKVTYFKD